jgi:hypothetical protein
LTLEFREEVVSERVLFETYASYPK